MNNNTQTTQQQEKAVLEAEKKRRKKMEQGNYLFKSSELKRRRARKQRDFNQLETTPPLRTFWVERHTDSRRNGFFLFEPLWETLCWCLCETGKLLTGDRCEFFMGFFLLRPKFQWSFVYRNGWRFQPKKNNSQRKDFPQKYRKKFQPPNWREWGFI